MIGPVTLWKAEDAPSLTFTATYPEGEHTIKIYWRPFGKNFEESCSTEFSFRSNGKQHTYKVPLYESAQYKGNLKQLKIIVATKQLSTNNNSALIHSIVLGK